MADATWHSFSKVILTTLGLVIRAPKSALLREGPGAKLIAWISKFEISTGIDYGICEKYAYTWHFYIMSKIFLFGLFVVLFAGHGAAWTDGELLIWISDNRGYRALVELGKKFERELGVSVKVETQENITNKFQAAAQSGKGPDIFLWANDRIGEWADAGLLKPLKIGDDFKAAFLPMAWEAVTHRRRIWGYPLALECVSLICNKELVTEKPPTQLSEFPAFDRRLKAKNPELIAIMWDYTSPYFSFPFLASAGAYSFKRTEGGFDLNDIGVDNAGAVKGLKAIVELINEGVLPKGSTQSIMEQKMSSGVLATMVNGPWVWADLRKSGIDFELAPLPGVGGNPGKPFVGVLTALINRSSPNADFAVEFLEKYVCTNEGLTTIDAEAPLGVPARIALAEEMSARNPLIKGTYENVLNGTAMPNIPQMGKFWSSMKAAFELATSGRTSPEAALKAARKNMKSR
jgi:maltose/maltodextrin transport system substrate-binding protein